MEKLQKVENSTKQVDDMVKFILKDYLTELDGYINIVKSCFLSDKEVSEEDLNKVLLQIPIYLYNLIPLVEEIEMQKSLSKEHSKYTKNDALLKSTGTVAEKTAKAENAGIEDRIAELAYETASSIIKSKIEGAMAIWDGAKKVQAQRSKEKALTNMVGSAVGSF